MTTLMAWYNSEGLKGRCDARCHNAKHGDCDCMCGGRYHGGARDGSLGRRVEQYGEEILERARQRAEAQGLELEAQSLNELIERLQDGRGWPRRRRRRAAPRPP